jgi:hypothetical protein
MVIETQRAIENQSLVYRDHRISSWGLSEALDLPNHCADRGGLLVGGRVPQRLLRAAAVGCGNSAAASQNASSMATCYGYGVTQGRRQT